MKTVNLYKFHELDKQAKEKARDWYREGALDYDWWDFIYEDAATIGLKIDGFDIDRSRPVDGSLTVTGLESCKLILANHGESCDTYKLALEHIDRFQTLEDRLAAHEDGDEAESRIEDLEEEFLYALREKYASMIQNECEYLLSDESVDERIKLNEYTFSESGKIERHTEDLENIIKMDLQVAALIAEQN